MRREVTMSGDDKNDKVWIVRKSLYLYMVKSTINGVISTSPVMPLVDAKKEKAILDQALKNDTKG